MSGQVGAYSRPLYMYIYKYSHHKLSSLFAACYQNMRWMSIVNNCMCCTVRLDMGTSPFWTSRRYQSACWQTMKECMWYKREIGFEGDLSYSEKFTYGNLTAMDFYAWLTADLTDTLRTSGNSLRQAWILVSGRYDEYMWNLERCSIGPLQSNGLGNETLAWQNLNANMCRSLKWLPVAPFATCQLRTKCFDSWNVRTEWERILGLWILECSKAGKASTFQKRPAASNNMLRWAWFSQG